jgi:hypothetical protein
MSTSGLGQSSTENSLLVPAVLSPVWVVIFALLNKGDCQIAKIPLKTFPALSCFGRCINDARGPILVEGRNRVSGIYHNPTRRELALLSQIGGMGDRIDNSKQLSNPSLGTSPRKNTDRYVL